MRSISFYIFQFLFSASVLVACNSSKNMQDAPKDFITQVKMEKVTMGSSSSLTVTKDEILNTFTTRNGTGDAVAGKTSAKDWNKLNALISKLDLSQIDQWEGPTQARFYDGAKATVIIIESGANTYNSQSFDEGEPPAQLKELYNYLESLEVQ